ncbi:MAG TPA: Clp protease N-terminal domain-containing protein [Candidatus Dormibacteraeota bacterium]|nr:Clp protease N-terminal domain-containing protein [Candidatus Dormibacteraeota bacterium]
MRVRIPIQPRERANKAENEAEQLKHDYVSTEHILLAAAEHPVLAEMDEIIVFRPRVTEPAKELLAEREWGPVYRARRPKRTIQRLLQDKPALLILEGRFPKGDQVVVDAERCELLFNKAAPVEETAARAGASGAR